MPIALLILLCQSALAGASAEVIFDSALYPKAERFQLALETPEQALGRPQLALVDGHLSAAPGNGNFTAWEFAQPDGREFTLLVRFSPPADAEDSNSGIFLRHGDPSANVSDLPELARRQHEAALAAAAEKKQRYGAGPFELDYFAYEIQLARGKAVAHDPANKRTGTFYGVPEGDGAGTQRIFNAYELFPGEEYELRIEARAGTVSTFLRSVRHQPAFVPIARLALPALHVDSVRGGPPRSLLLQAYWNNGSTAKGIRFHHLSFIE